MGQHRKSKAQQTEPLPLFAFTVKEATEVARVGRTLIYEAIRRGDLKSLKVAGKRLVRPDQLKAWLDSHEV